MPPEDQDASRYFLSDFDLYLFGEGRNTRIHRKFGAQLAEMDGAHGVNFAVWAPNASAVSVVGSFNRWSDKRHPMTQRGTTGVWERFVPDVGEGDLYKFHIRSRNAGPAANKADPVGFAMEARPKTASIVHDPSRYRWRDQKWMASRPQRQAPNAPLSIYEVHLGSWRRVAAEGNRWASYRELGEWLIPYAKSIGFTHLELLPVSEHPFDGSWGYQTTGYFAPTSRFGSPDDFRWFVDTAHRAGLGVLLDWVPAHFPKDPHGLANFDGTHLYEHADPRKGHHKDWDTLIFNYGRPQVLSFLVSNALFWCEEYHIDGLRVDAVASMLYLDYSRKEGEWIPNRYGGRENLEAVTLVRQVNETLHAECPDVLIMAEESTSWPGVTAPIERRGLGFDLKWNMGWMHDTLEYFKNDPVDRRHHQRKLTFSFMYAFSERFLLPLSHDEVVHGKRSLLGKMPGDAWRKCANLRALIGYQFAHPGKKLLFMGGEIGQRREWHHDRELDWALLEDPLHAGLQKWVRAVNRLYRAEPALHQVDSASEGFAWIDFRDEASSVFSFLRRAEDRSDQVVVIANLTPVPRSSYRIGVPEPGRYRVLLNSDAASFGGSGYGTVKSVTASDVPWHDLPQSIVLDLPPLAILFLKKSGGAGQAGAGPPIL